MKSLIAQIQAEDPSYDPVTLACEKGGVDAQVFAAALDRVYIDGYYGPVSSADWQEEDGREPSSVPGALAVLERVSAAIDGYREPFYGEDEDGEEVERKRRSPRLARSGASAGRLSRSMATCRGETAGPAAADSKPTSLTRAFI